MQWPDPESMAKGLVPFERSATLIHQMTMEKFGTAPSIRRIAAWRGLWCASQLTRVAHNCKPMPEDFAELAPTMTKTELARHYGTKWSGTIDRWLKEAGVSARRHIPKRNRMSNMGKPRKPSLAMIYQKEPDEEAADVLRRERFPVNRCNQDGRYNANGLWWRVGRNVLTKQEIIEKARRYK